MPADYLYAADFSGTTGANGIDVFDSTFTNVSATTFAGKFIDPNIPAGFKPFNIAFLNDDLYVAYAKPSGTSTITGTGGYIDEFDASGNFIKTIYSDTAGKNLNGPWGMELFGTNDLVVSNFGGASGTAPSGTFALINLTTDTFAGTIDGSDGLPITDPGLWGLASGSAGLYFTAEIDSQTHGLLGVISFATAASGTVAGLAPSTTQPTVSTTEGMVFSGPVGSFTDTNPAATTSNYDVTIDWGDGTPETAGTVVATSTADTFNVIGTHTYADAGVNGGIGHFPITIDVHDINSTTTTITDTANVADVPLVVTGKLNPASDSGASDSDDITNVVQPNFFGTTNQPFATVTLYATAAGSTTPVVIGQGVSNAKDAWPTAATRSPPSPSIPPATPLAVRRRSSPPWSSTRWGRR